jgi:rRNA biogenesis protein RRP5
MEFRHADAERGKTLFEELLDRYPKRLDLVSVYIDQLVRVPDVQAVRSLVDRTLEKKLTAKKAK